MFFLLTVPVVTFELKLRTAGGPSLWLSNGAGPTRDAIAMGGYMDPIHQCPVAMSSGRSMALGFHYTSMASRLAPVHGPVQCTCGCQ